MVKLPGQPTQGSQTGRPVMVLLDALSKRWTMRVIWELSQSGSSTFRELQSRCEDVSPTSLNQRIKDLRTLGLVSSGDQGYALTGQGQSLAQLLLPLGKWADRWADELTQEIKESGETPI